MSESALTHKPRDMIYLDDFSPAAFKKGTIYLKKIQFLKSISSNNMRAWHLSKLLAILMFYYPRKNDSQ